MEYTLVLPVPFFRTGEGEFACESAFAKHLIELRKRVPPRFTALRVCGPVMSPEQFALIASHAGYINEQEEGVFLTELNPAEARSKEFWTRHAAPTFKKLWNTVKASGLIHSGPSTNVLQPNEIVSLFCAKLQNRKTIAVVDIDERNDSRRMWALKAITHRRFLVERLVFDPLRSVQFWWVARYCSLVLFKGKALVDDYGRGRQSVKNFFDTAHSASHVISVARLEQKLARLHSPDEPVRLTYFGRLVSRKGIDQCVRSVVAARKELGANVSLTIIGDGPEKETLSTLTQTLNAQDFIYFRPPVAFGPVFFDTLYDLDVLLAAPVTEDTPRSAFDAMAAGMAICAYDTEYYKTLEQLGPTVLTTKWMSIDSMASCIAALARDRERLSQAQLAARELALRNTQEFWLEERATWTRQFCG